MPMMEKPGHQVPLRHRSDQKSQNNLQTGAGEIERVLHPSHEVLRHLFHDAGIHGDAAHAAARAHHAVDRRTATASQGDSGATLMPIASRPMEIAIERRAPTHAISAGA